MQFVFVGDPNVSDDPTPFCDWCGFRFARGVAVEVEDAAMIARLVKNSHFTAVQGHEPVVLKKAPRRGKNKA